MTKREPWIQSGELPRGAERRLVRNACAVVLAGGRGSRLHQLTDWRPKPSLPFGGKFRIIDFTLSNCINSGVRRIGVCTQYRAQSLIRHLQRGWSFLDGRFGDFVEILPAQQRAESSWYRGTADAVYQNLDIMRRIDARYILVLAGDHVYKMDYARLLEDHVARGGGATVACIEVPIGVARSFGVATADERGHIVRFDEKPESPACVPGNPGRALVSMGVYAFDAAFLFEALRADALDEGSTRDFGRDILPRLAACGAPLHAHHFAASCVNRGTEHAYWRDVGTVDAYWEANMDLTHVVPELDLYDRDWPVWTYQEQMPPAKFVFDTDERRGEAVDSLVSGGCVVSGGRVRRSLLFTNVRLHSHSTVEDSVVLPDVEVGRGAVVRRAVIDKGCRLPDGFTVGVDAEADRKRFHVTPAGVTLVVPEMLGQDFHASHAIGATA